MHHAVTQTILCFLNTPPLKINDRLSNLHEFNYVLCRPHTHTIHSHTKWKRPPHFTLADVRWEGLYRHCHRCKIQLFLLCSIVHVAFKLMLCAPAHTHTHTHSPSRFCSLLFHCFYLISSSTISPSHQFHQVSAENYSFCTRSLSPLIRAALIRLGNWLKFQPMILQIINTNIYQLVSHLTVYIRSIFSSHFRHILPN